MTATVSVKVDPESWALMQTLPDWAIFHPDLERVWNEVAAGQPLVNGHRIVAEVTGRLRGMAG